MTLRNRKESVIPKVIREEIKDVRVCIPAKVVSYDPSTQTAKCRPMVKNRIKNNRTGEVAYEEIKPISDVPVLWQAGGGMSFVMDLDPGDDVVLIVADRSIDEWQNSTSDSAQEPFSSRRYNLSDALAIPAGRRPADSLDSDHYASDGAVLKVPKIYIGDSTASEALAVAQSVESRLANVVQMFNVHNHVSATPGSPGGPPISPMNPVVQGEFNSSIVFTSDGFSPPGFDPIPDLPDTPDPEEEEEDP